jgi:glycine cleavage system H protein
MIIDMKISDYEMPEDLFYTNHYAWVRKEGKTLRVGVIDFAVKLAGKIEYVDLPSINEHYEKDDVYGTIESGKWVGEMVMPISGTIMEVNSELLDNPNPVYDDPYGTGWLIIMNPDKMENLSSLLSDPDEIAAWLEEEIKIKQQKDKKS